MSYATIANIAYDASIRPRLTACAAEQAKPAPVDTWVLNHIWQIAASPGWADAWEYAIASGNTDPGGDEAVITDGMILAVIQPME